MQDVLSLDNGSRMNVPGSAEGNWEWRLSARALGPKLAKALRQYALTYGRVPLSESSDKG
jgi:4-alpha-glucanotransferase